MTHDPEAFAAIAAAAAPAFSRDGRTLFHLRGSGLPQVWALDLATGNNRQVTFHDEKVALLRRSPVDDRLIHGIDRGGDERQQLLLIDPRDASPQPRELTANPAPTSLTPRTTATRRTSTSMSRMSQAAFASVCSTAAT
jgi:Tol biopolymer transport system component